MARAAITPPTRPATPADSRGAGLEVLVEVVAAAAPVLVIAVVASVVADVVAVVAVLEAAVAVDPVPVPVPVVVLLFSAVALLVSLAVFEPVVEAAAAVPLLPNEVAVQETTDGRPVTP